MSDNRPPDDVMAEFVARAGALSAMRCEERRAADLLRELLGGGYAPRDAGGAQGMHDFDLRLGDGRAFAVEVTTDTSRVDMAFWDQIGRVSQLRVRGLTRVWQLGVATPGDGSDDQRAARERVEALEAGLPDILGGLERAGLTELRVPRSPHRDDAAAQVGLRGLGVRMCFSRGPAPGESPQVMLAPAGFGGFTGPSTIADAVSEHLPRSLAELVEAKVAGAAEAHLFLWLKIGQEHKHGPGAAMSFLAHTGLGGLPPIGLRGIDAVWVAVDAGPGHAPDCRHYWPIVCFDAHGWHDWRLRRSP